MSELPLNDDELKYIRYLIKRSKIREADFEFADSIEIDREF